MAERRTTVALTPADCDRIVEACRAHVAPQIRDDRPTQIVDQPTMRRLLGDTVATLADVIGSVDDLKFAVRCYGPGQGCEEHVDTFPAAAVRRWAAVVQLSPADSYEGGDLEGHEDGRWVPILPRDQGAAVVFAGHELSHRVTPVTAGQRWALGYWTFYGRGLNG